MSMKDELDFDLAAFRYVNLGRSRHRGVEAALHIDGRGAAGFAHYTLQAATSRSGDHSGKRLKAIPRHSIAAGLSVRPRAWLEAAVQASHVREIFLDDANTELPDYTRVDTSSRCSCAGSVLVAVRNLLGSEYSTTGFRSSGSGKRTCIRRRAVIEAVRGGW
jgi:outer membrane receptor for ferrienterochelin and colicin